MTSNSPWHKEPWHPSLDWTTPSGRLLLRTVDVLIRAVNIYRPGYDESATGDPVYNTRLLWQRLFGKQIDVRREIIIPGNT